MLRNGSPASASLPKWSFFGANDRDCGGAYLGIACSCLPKRLNSEDTLNT